MKEEIEIMTVGGGCFWCTEAIFKEIRGVQKVISGYSGTKSTHHPTYKEVCSGLTEFAEVVQVFFDKSLVSYDELLLIFMTSHDPTTLNRQGADAGRHYRSVIFFHNEKQEKTAEKVIQDVSKLYENTITTEISPLVKFFIAEEYHQNYYENNPSQNYCRIVISPKLAKFRNLHKEKLKNKKQLN